LGVKERKARQRESLRREIVDAASDLFVAEGFESVSMRKIADRIEYSPTTIYLYFKNKAELLETICDETFEQMIEIHERIRRDSPDPLDALVRGLRAYVDFGLAHSSHYVLTFVAPYPDGERPEGAFDDSVGARSFGVLRAIVTDCIAAGHFAGADVEAASQQLWAVVHGVTSLLIVQPDFPWVDRDELVDGLIETVIAGLERTKREPRARR
jgi:AcrR family transcriptional regulator